jgi:gas vesicle protein
MKTKNTQHEEGMSGGAMVAVGAGIAAVAAASYLLLGPSGKENREKMKDWMSSMKEDVIEKMKDVKELTEPVYHKIVDAAVASQVITSKLSREDLMAFADRLKGQWKEIVASGKKRAQEEKKILKKSVKKVMKK